MNTGDMGGGSAGPIFICGLSYSGKTPLRRLLGAHPNVAMFRHVGLWWRYRDRWNDLGNPVELDRALDTLFADRALSELEPHRAYIRATFRLGAASQARLFALLYELRARQMGRERWGEQLGPADTVAGQLLEALPAVRIIHMVRDPSARLAPSRSTRPGTVGWNTARWIDSVDRARLHTRERRAQYRIVRYEDLTAEPVATLQGVCEFCDLEPTAGMIEMAATLRLDHHERGAASERRRPFVERHAGRRLVNLGYASSPDGVNAHPPARSIEDPVDRCAMAAWRLVGRHMASRQRTA